MACAGCGRLLEDLTCAVVLVSVTVLRINTLMNQVEDLGVFIQLNLPLCACTFFECLYDAGRAIIEDLPESEKKKRRF